MHSLSRSMLAMAMRRGLMSNPRMTASAFINCRCYRTLPLLVRSLQVVP
jgi:hypothetical protein